MATESPLCNLYEIYFKKHNGWKCLLIYNIHFDQFLCAVTTRISEVEQSNEMVQLSTVP